MDVRCRAKDVLGGGEGGLGEDGRLAQTTAPKKGGGRYRPYRGVERIGEVEVGLVGQIVRSRGETVGRTFKTVRCSMDIGKRGARL